MADFSNRADSVQVTCSDTSSSNSPAGFATGANGQAPASEGGSVPEALCGLSTAMQRAVANFVAARDYYCSLPVDSDKDENDRAEAAYLQADGVMLETPAENLHDLRAKFDAIWSDAAALPNESTVLAVFADFRRLTGGDVSPIFNPQTWLRYFELRGGAYVVRGDEVFLLQPDGAKLEDNLFELEALGGKPAFDALIRQRCAQEVDHG
jgi:hypothetical protein